jgi:trigger factor
MSQIVKDKNLKTVGDPEIVDIVNNDVADLEFTLQYELLPDVPMPDWSKISVEKPVLDITEEMVEEAIGRLQTKHKKYDVEVEKNSKMGDQVTLSCVGSIDGVPFDGGVVTNHKLVLGSGSFIPGFEEQLVGKKKGEHVIVNVRFPDDYHAENLAGKESVFATDVLSVHESKDMAIDDEFAKLCGAENLEELRTNIKNEIAKAYSTHIRSFMKKNIFDKVGEIVSFDLPKSLVKKEQEILNGQIHNHHVHDENCNHAGEDEKMHELAVRRVKLGLILAEYIKNSELSVSENDLNNAIIEQMRSNPGYEKQIIDFFLKNKDNINSLRAPILEEKAIDEIIEKYITVEEKIYSQKDLEALLFDDEEEESK